jgi:hypothetical protein
MPFSLTHRLPEPMKDASEDEQEEDVMALSKGASSSTQGKARLAREEALRKMMDDEGPFIALDQSCPLDPLYSTTPKL